ncbi:Sulfate adenylyltransferase subunit 2 [Mesorhizobium plurifarium]|jgi:2-oxo-3-hexenedioate decarboxylase/2-keto-4-pentenoate hydratase|uniref:Sulfate adenylyltransferase subunit 2 n=2 Tax=Mesorhizobium TaxID=68287 RepID=A0A090FWN6_MESPL|nr:Sulfate adenylyltransferase subunit 2 [Mesorhizobium plurifarium]CDX51352.1 Sulfate adenylyltransferase subunit 2 [Mesorhizobium plurifarium]
MAFDIVGAAQALVRGHRDNTQFVTIEGLSDLASAYKVQDAYVGSIIGDDRIAGYKIGLTSHSMQSMCGIDHPVAGAVFGRRVMHSGAKLSLTGYGHLGVEFEICARLGRDLAPRAAPYTRDEVAAAVDGVCAAVEVVDDRHADYSVLDVRSLVADNSWNAGVVLGDFVAPPAALEKVEAVVYQDGVEIGRGVGADALGHPYEPLAWLADHLGASGRGMKAGDIVMTGSIVRTRFPDKAFSYRFDIAGLGSVEVSGA